MPAASQVWLSFNEFNTEQYHDILWIFHGDDTHARVERPEGFSGATSPPDIQSAGSSLLLLFVSGNESLDKIHALHYNNRLRPPTAND